MIILGMLLLQWNCKGTDYVKRWILQSDFSY